MTANLPIPFIGTKQLRAQPMTRGEYNEFRGWTVPADENPADEGYIVEYLDGGKPNTSQFAGYISWSPKEQFERAYRPTFAMTFGLAIEALKQGKKVARAGWNGKGMFIYLNKGSVDGEQLGFKPGEHPVEDHHSTIDGIPLGLFGCGHAGTGTRLPNIDMQTATGARLMGWLASQTDMLAEDWVLVD